MVAMGDEEMGDEEEAAGVEEESDMDWNCLCSTVICACVYVCKAFAEFNLWLHRNHVCSIVIYARVYVCKAFAEYNLWLHRWILMGKGSWTMESLPLCLFAFKEWKRMSISKGFSPTLIKMGMVTLTQRSFERPWLKMELMTLVVANDIFQEINANKDGQINYEEFAAMMKTRTDWGNAFRHHYSRERFNILSIRLMKDGSINMAVSELQLNWRIDGSEANHQSQLEYKYTFRHRDTYSSHLAATM